jgi:hypothetical protein
MSDAARPFTLDVEAGKIREFARAVHGDDAGHLDADNRVSAPTYLMTAAFWRTPDNEVLDHGEFFSRSLHATEEFVFYGPPPTAGTCLVGTSRLGAVEHKTGRRGGNMTFIEVITDFCTAEGRLVVRNSSVTVFVETPPAKS